MRSIIFAMSLTIAGTPATPTLAQAAATSTTPAPSPALTKCERLKREWRGYEEDLAARNAEGLGDNSAPRATLRATEDLATQAAAATTLRLMELNKCELPTGAPSYARFMLPALQCETKRIGASAADIRAGIPECDRGKWTAAY